MRLILNVIISIALATLIAGCSDDKSEQPVDVNFDTGLIMSISLPAGFRIQSHELKPWVLLVHLDDGRAFSLQAVVPADDNWINIGNLPQAYSVVREHAIIFSVDGREWVLIPLEGVIAFSVNEDIRLYFLAQGDWTTRAAMNLIRSIKVRNRQDES